MKGKSSKKKSSCSETLAYEKAEMKILKNLVKKDEKVHEKLEKKKKK